MAIKAAQYKGKSLVSKIIKFVSRGQYSHTAIILPDGRIVEAWEGSNKVRVIKNLSDGHTAGTPVDIYAMHLSLDAEIRFVEFINKQIGMPYNKRGLIAFYFNKFNINKKGSWFCSQLFAAGCYAAGCYFWGERTETWQISPSMVIRNDRFTLIDSVVTE